MRGEHRALAQRRRHMVGSSPHARGAPISEDLRGQRQGLIPACAGSTGTGPPPSGGTPAHPRMRGEHAWFNAPAFRAVGSSPHARGPLDGVSQEVAHDGLIPACAGSTLRLLLSWRPTGGSSPHARGAPFASSPDIRRAGLIPACAGSTLLLALWRTRIRAHPRMRGEHSDGSPGFDGGSGSSPHARRAHNHLTVQKHSGGLIPACAGSTATINGVDHTHAAHPRMRGEHSPICCRVACWGGSSPHARGARGGEVDEYRIPGLIPACAGSTSHSTRTVRALRAHPRMRGEHSARRARPRRR